MKIKTITCHDVYNVGASLQAYALMKFLQMQGYDVEIINYKPDYLSHHYQLFYADNPAYRKNFLLKFIYVICKLPLKIKQQKRKKIFNQFTKEYLILTKKYESNEQLKKECPEADVYIAGSDQIWNPLFDNGRDPAFFLDFVPANKKRVSYAASFAINKMPEDNIDFAKKNLSKFDCISVRENTGLKILEQLNINKGIEVLDPVFLLEKDKWLLLTDKDKLIKENYILVYDFDNSKVIESISKKISKSKNLKIVSMFKNDYSDINFTNAGPLEFLNLINNADVVISNSFHATAFSIILEKDFYVIGRKENVNSRMIDLLKKFKLEQRFLMDEDIKFEKVNYEEVENSLNNYISQSKNYLIDSILGVNNENNN